jgi:hypothetical protein
MCNNKNRQIKWLVQPSKRKLSYKSINLQPTQACNSINLQPTQARNSYSK